MLKQGINKRDLQKEDFQQIYGKHMGSNIIESFEAKRVPKSKNKNEKFYPTGN
jgi:hypothetical protein